MIPERVRIVEVGPRDGLQNEPVTVPTAAKVQFIRGLAAAGLQHIEAASFVHPKSIPQLADAAAVVRDLPSGDRLTFSALVPNERGLDRALEAGIGRIAVFTAASDSFTRHNIRMTVNESLDVFRPVIRRALDNGMTVRGYLSTAFVCPYEGDIAPGRVRDLTLRLLELGCDEVAVSDTIGAAAPNNVVDTLGVLLAAVPGGTLALHLHDTYGTALANVYAALQLGITTFDSAAGGLGGCPYAPGAAGNLATEDLVYMLDRMGISTGVDAAMIVQAARAVARNLGRQLNSKQARRLAPDA